MRYPIKYTEIGSKTEFYSEVILLHKEATDFLMSFSWCKSILNSHLYLNLGSTLCIFLFDVENIASKDDNKLWVIVGDIPPMYLDTYGPRTTKEVLEDYVRLAYDWINNVKLGKSVENCYPFKAKPTKEMAGLLEQKVSFMKTTLIDNIDDIPLIK